MSQPIVVVAGSVAQRPFIGGHTWVLLQYLLGFRRLGWDVHLIDRLEPDMCVDEQGRPAPVRQSANLAYLDRVMTSVGMAGRWTLGYDGWREVFGVPREDTLDRVSRSRMLLNVMGFLDDAELLAAAQRRVFLDIDPGFGQMWRQLGLHDLFAGHDQFVTIGENVGRAGCSIPTCELEWITTKQPVFLDEWPVQIGPGSGFTSVVTWRGPFAPIIYEGRTYGLRVHEFRRFMELPERTGQRFELALDIDASDGADTERLATHGWQLVEPRTVASDPWRYRQYVQRSRAELMIAKNLYVQTGSGWFSDRSACYLASGRPVLAQDTGLEAHLPVGEGVLTFTDLESAVQATAAIEGDYDRHAMAARRIAEEHFDSSRVLTRLVDRLEVA